MINTTNSTNSSSDDNLSLKSRLEKINNEGKLRQSNITDERANIYNNATNLILEASKKFNKCSKYYFNRRKDKKEKMLLKC